MGGQNPSRARGDHSESAPSPRLAACQIGACSIMSFLGSIGTAMRPLCVPLLAFFLCGCANVEYTAYSGRQQNWPVASGSFVQRKFDLPVYFGPPDRPYRVLGYMETESAPLAVWETGKSESLKPAVKEAAKHGADALVLLASGTNIGGSTTFSSGQWGSNTTTTGGVYGNYFNAQSRTTGGGFGSTTTLPMRQAHTRVLAIKFL